MFHGLPMYNMPEQNGVSKRLNWTLLECTHTMLHASSLPKALWGKAIHHTVWLKNCTSTRVLNGQTPYKVLNGIKPELLKLCECDRKAWVHTIGNSKLNSRTREGCWVGFNDINKGYHICWPEKHAISVKWTG